MSTFSLTIAETEVSQNTSLITNITDTELLERVFPTTSATVEYTFDRNVGRQTSLRTLVATFGDGYEQRVGNGINVKQEQFGINFGNRSSDDITVISAFLDNKIGDNFDIVIDGVTIKVACDSYNTTYINTGTYTLNTTFRRVYEP